MSGPRDTTPPPPAPVTSPTLEDDEYVIPAGQARAACLDVLGDLARAVGRTEQFLQALARALDATAEPREATTT